MLFSTPTYQGPSSQVIGQLLGLEEIADSNQSVEVLVSHVAVLRMVMLQEHGELELVAPDVTKQLTTLICACRPSQPVVLSSENSYRTDHVNTFQRTSLSARITKPLPTSYHNELLVKRLHSAQPLASIAPCLLVKRSQELLLA